MIRGSDLDGLIAKMTDDYLAGNRAARTVSDLLNDIGVGFSPVIDHLTIRTADIDARVQEFLELGYSHSETLNFDDWYAKVYRCVGYPALFVDQAYSDERGKTSIIPGWVRQFGDHAFHHLAIRVQNIEQAIAKLRSRDVAFAGEIVGPRGGKLRQIFTAPEIVSGHPFSVLELAERHEGYQGFSPPQADSLMKATVQPS